MEKRENEAGRIDEHSRGLGTPTRGMVRARARQLAEINGRSPDKLLRSDFEQAWRELTGRGELPSDEPDADYIIETAQWDPAPGTPGHKLGVTSAHDEQTDNERLIEEGMEEAEHDRMVEGTEDSLRREQL